MLHFHHSNRMEALLESLCAVVAQVPADPFIPETIVVQNAGMGQWLSQAIAQKQGILANSCFPLPAQFIWRLFRSQLSDIPEDSAFAPDALQWRCMALLPDLQGLPEYKAIDEYLSGTETETKRYQLSQRIAQLFDQYLLYRPDFIQRWERGEESHWQAHFWRAVRASTEQPHWNDLVGRFVQQLRQNGFRANAFGDRVCLFGLTSLTPEYLNMLVELSQQLDVHLFLLNPSVNYWGDIVSPADLARLRVIWQRNRRADVSELYDIGNPLLASMGKQGRDFLDQLHQLQAQEWELYVDVAQDSLLHRVQGDILHLQNKGAEDWPANTSTHDKSISVHSCHSPIREAQVLQDTLLQLFNSTPTLMPHEVLVMMPDLDCYGPYIEAVFGSADANRFIPYRLSGRTNTAEHPLVALLLSWLQLPNERFESPTLLSWLEQPAVQNKFSLDDKALDRLRDWVREAGICWGLHGAHRAELGLPDWGNNSWEFGFDRLLAGFSLPTTIDLYRDIATLSNIEGAEVIWLGQLQRILALLEQWRKTLQQPATVTQWQRRINLLISDFFHADDQDELALNRVRCVMDEWVQQANIAQFSDPVSAAIVRQHLSIRLKSSAENTAFFSGAVTFSSITAMRGIPFRVICLLGMNDVDFPGRQQPLGFDLIAQRPRKGDRILREEDRYAFLQCLLSAGEQFYISYVGRSQQDNSKKEPSVLVSELLEYAEHKVFFIEHPLQPFSARNFELGSYGKEWLDRPPAAANFSEQPIAPPAETLEQIELTMLCQFIENPSKYFLQQRLGIQAKEYEESLQATEPFQIDNLQRYQLKTEMLHLFLADGSIEESFTLASARGELPDGNFGRIDFQQSQHSMQQLAAAIRPSMHKEVETLEVDLMIAGIRLVGWLKPTAGSGLFRYAVNECKPKNQLKLWVEHLALCAMGRGEASRFIEWKMKIIAHSFRPVEPQQAMDWLADMVEQYRCNLLQPVPLFPKSSVAFAAILQAGKTEQEAFGAARKVWEGAMGNEDYQSGEACDPWFKLAFRGKDPIHEVFAALAKKIASPMLSHWEKQPW